MGRKTGSICLVANDFDYVVRNGGIGTCNTRMAQLLADQGWRVHVLYCVPAEDPAALAELPRWLAREGIGFTNLDDFLPPNIPPIAAQHNAWYTHRSDRVRHALEHLHHIHHFDLIEFAEWQGVGFRVLQAKRAGLCLADTRLLVKLHSSSQWQREGNLLWLNQLDDLKLDFSERYSFENADIQVAPCHYMLEYAQSIGWKVREDARVIRYAFPAPSFVPALRMDERAPEIVFFGRLETRKGLEFFLDAVQDLDPRVPITFLGKDTVLGNGVVASQLIASRLQGRSFKIHTTWNREQALGYICGGNRLVVIASLMDNLPNTVIECAVNGIPFLASNVGGIPELLPDPDVQARLLFAPNARDLRRCLGAYLQSHPAQRLELREQVRRLTDVDRNNAQVGADYEELLVEVAAAAAPVAVAVGAVRTDNLPHRVTAASRQRGPGDSNTTAADGSDANKAEDVFPLVWPTEQGASTGKQARKTGPAPSLRLTGNSHSADGPLVTVCVTYYNLGAYLPDALASLAAQTYRNLEVLVIDDGSTSPIAIRVFEEQQRRYPQFRFLSQANTGPGAARNRCLAESNGTYFIPMDADNIALPEMVECFVQAIQRNLELSALTCYLLAFEETSDIERGNFRFAYHPLGGPCVMGMVENVFGDTNAIFRTADLRAIGGFIEFRETRWEDWETFVKLSIHGLRVDVLPAYLVYYRHRADGRSQSTGHAYHCQQRILRQYLEAEQFSVAERLALWTALFSLGQRSQNLSQQTGSLQTENAQLHQHCQHLQHHCHHLHSTVGQLQDVVQVQQTQLRVLRYRMIDKLNNQIKKLPMAHTLAKNALTLTWKAWKGLQHINPLRRGAA